MADISTKETLSGLVERVTFHSGETGFAVLRVNVPGHRDLVTIVGTLPSVSAGEWVEAQGSWLFDREHGQQFKAWTIHSAPPNTLEGIEKYLGSGLVRGIGPAFAQRLVGAFGEDVFAIIENSPDQLLNVDGIGSIRQERILTAWSEQKAVREIMVFLHSHNVGTARAFRIYKTYGDDAIQVVTENPYRLAQDIWGIGFKTADQIAASLGIDKHSEIRAEAGVGYVLGTLTDDGHCAYPRKELVIKTADILEIPVEIVEQAMDHELSEGRLVQRRSSSSQSEKNPNLIPLIYLASLDGAEKVLARNLVDLSKGVHPCPKIDTEVAIKWAEQKVGLLFAKTQIEAIRTAIKNKVLVISGGPGVGKTTLLNAILKIFLAKNLHAVLCAPTGRAAKRMNESVGLEAKTVHRLLEFDPKTAKFKRNHENPLCGDVFVIDESSMLDLVLAHQLIRAIPKPAALILVGDVDQLPSVGPGKVLSDIIDSGIIPVCRLTEIFRQAAESRIIVNSHRINKGVMPVYPREKVTSPGESDFYFIEVKEAEDAEMMIRKLVSDNIPEKFGFTSQSDIQVLTPMQRGILGARNLNQALQQELNPSGHGIERFGLVFRVGDKIMQIVNDYDKEVFNGDIGYIVGLNDDDREAVLDYEGRKIKYLYDEFDEIVLAYAITIHKSQGSEFPCVVLPIHTQHYMMLQRNLLYTAITRGRRLVIVIGTRKALAIAVKRLESRERITTLKERLLAVKES